MVTQPDLKINPSNGVRRVIIKPSSEGLGGILIRRDQIHSRNERVYLLPKTVEYYQEQLTQLMESERFAEATRMLAFLLECRTDDALTVAEWQHLYDWLVTTFGEPDASGGANGGPAGDDPGEVGEEELRKQRLAAKMAADPGYVDKLLGIVREASDLEQKMLAVDQLALADHPRIDAALIAWLEEERLHPLLQFKVLQVLRMRGASGTAVLHRAGERVAVPIAVTPLGPEEFPAPIRTVADMVKTVCEQSEPAMAGFAGHIWQEFLACVYGTKLYRTLEQMPARGCAIWAAGLHAFMILSVTGDDPEPSILPSYNLTKADLEQVKQSRALILAYMRNPYGPE